MKTNVITAGVWVLAAALMCGCQSRPDPVVNLRLAGASPAKGKVPSPLSVMLPQSIRIHPFTGVRTFEESGGARGMEVRIEALDAYDDNTKAFGDFRFELYSYRAQSADHKGDLIDTWEEALGSPAKNAARWDRITRSYIFKLRFYKDVPGDQRHVLVTVFSSPYTKRMFAQRVVSAE